MARTGDDLPARPPRACGGPDPRLDGLRALAILAIVLFHFGDAYPRDTWSGRIVAGALSGGWTGVELFFVLSGFLVTRRLLEERDLPAFLARRALRILPPYLAFLALWFFAVPAVARWSAVHGLVSGVDRAAFPWFFDVGADRQAWYWLLGGSWTRLPGTRVPMLSHLWFVSVEVQLYVLWPIVVHWARGRRLSVVCVVLASTGVAARIAMLRAGVAPDAVYELPPARLEGFALGALVATALRDGAGQLRLRRILPAAAGLGAAGTTAAFLVAGAPDLYARPVQLFGYTSLDLLAAAALSAVLLAPSRAGWPRWLGSRPLALVARHSYAAYLFHFPLCFGAMALIASHRPQWLGTQPAYLAFMAAGIACTGLLAVAAWSLLERWTQPLAARLRTETVRSETAPPELQARG